MAHYVFLNAENVVVEVIKGRDEGELGIDWEQHYGNSRALTCLRTSYNTYGGVHSEGEIPFRKNFAGIGYSYNSELDAFISPKPYDSWALNIETCLWEAPTPRPADEYDAAEDKYYEYIWNEDTTSWYLFKG